MLDAVSITRDLIAIPSVNSMGKDVSGEIYSERQIALYGQAFLSRIGVDAKLVGADPIHPNLIGMIDVGCPETLLLEAHMDTVPHDNMTIDPFDPVIKDGLLYGRGSCDTKAALATYLYAIAEVINKGHTLRRNVIVAGVHDEEYSFGGARELVANDFSATFAVAGEPTSLDIIYAHKGVCRFFVSTSGKSAHAALPWLGENAIYRMAHVLKGIELYERDIHRKSHPELGPPTINVGRIEGGNAVNIVPSLCTIEVDRRLLPGEDFTSVKAELESYLSGLGESLHIEEPYLEAQGVYNDRNGIACKSLLDACTRTEWTPSFKTAHYGTDASVLSVSGIPTIVFGPGSVDLAHTEAEYVPIQEIEKASDIILSLLLGE